MSTRMNAGFSSVELLVSIFVAVAFVATGYQLYGVVIRDGADARARSRANNIAYETLRLYVPQVAAGTCAASTPAATLPANSGLSNASISVAITCPFGTTSKTSQVQVSVKYGSASPQDEVTHAIYAKD